ncbi:MAG: nucleotidyltransferase domain-containing protein [Pseudomonadota bacterium]|nr:nucleotidyltransferase domain-containing protein [Pseudomonadota bacterium]
MRLTPEQSEIIRHAARETFGPETQVWLFGSRVDDGKRGGDIDLLIQPALPRMATALTDKLRLLGALERRLGERRIDVIIEAPGDTRPIVQIAHATGIRL